MAQRFSIRAAFAPILLLSAGLLLSACTSTGTLAPGADVDTDEFSVVVVGMKQPGFYLSIWPVELSNGLLRRKSGAGVSIRGQAESGYVVGKVVPGQSYALLQISPDVGFLDSSDQVPGWVACGGLSTLTFDIDGGQVVYVADVEYPSAENDWKPKFSRDYYSAKIFMNKHYSKLTSRMTEGDALVVPSGEHCINYV